MSKPIKLTTMDDFKVIDKMNKDEVIFTGTHKECEELMDCIVTKYGYAIVPNESELNDLINDTNSKKI